MGVNLRFYSPKGLSGRAGSGVTYSPIYARVLDVITSESHPDYKFFGKSQCINGIRYRPIGDNIDESDPKNAPFAYQLDSHVKSFPLLGEIVEIIDAPSDDMNINPELHKKFYRKSVSIWNQANHNAFPDQAQNPGDINLGKDIIELGNIRSLHPFMGNITIEGRLGQSLRFFGYKSEKNIYTDDSNNGDPITILRNGQQGLITPEATALEDINLDNSSIYLTSNHTIPLRQANQKRTSYFTPPVLANQYKGSQIILNSERIFINSKKDDVLISSTKNIGLNSKTVNFDGNDFVSMDGKKVYLGDKAKTEKEWVVLGQQNENWLTDLLNLLNDIGNTLSTLPPSPAQAIGRLVILGSIVKATVTLLKSALPTLRSRKVFTE